jgi:hypothetical protein
MRKILILLLLLTLVSCSSFEQSEGNYKGAEGENVKGSEVNNDNSEKMYIKAAHYFGEEWPINFWSSELYGIDEDFNQIKSDGFNSIVLVVPWGEFQPKVNPLQYNDKLFNRLKFIIEKAEKHKLNVILRLGYAWDFDPDVQLPNVERLRALYTDEKVYNAWLAYLEKINETTSDYSNVSFAFLTWEDFWGIVEEASHLEKLNQRIELSRDINFPTYLKKIYSINELSKIYGFEISSWENIPIPKRETEAFKIFHQYIDQLLLERFFIPAKERFPKLSMEVRVDSDPIYLKNNEVEWYSHKKTFDLPNAEYTTTYYSPAMGAKNEGDEESASKSLERQESLFSDVKNLSNGKKVFVDQFLYYDNTPAFLHNTKIKPGELNNFIIGSLENLKKYSEGYGVWTYKDYAANTIYNSQFEMGLKGWSLVKGNAEILKLNGDNLLSLKTNSIITQNIAMDRDFYHKFAKTTKLWFNAKSTKKATNLTIKVGNYVINKTISNINEKYTIEIPTHKLNEYTLSFESKDGDVMIDDIKLFSFIQEGKIYSIDDKEGKTIYAFRRLNKELPKFVKSNAVSEFDANNNVDPILDEHSLIFKNSYHIEGEGDKKYFWVQKKSQITLSIDTNSTIVNIKGFIPYSLHEKVNRDMDSLTVSYYIDQKKIKDSIFTQDSEFNEQIKLNEIGNLIKNKKEIQLGIEVSSEINPKRDGIGIDERNLSIMLNHVKVE